MDKTQILKAFNDHFNDFIEDIHKVFPDNKDIETAKNAIAEFRKANPRMILLVFNQHVVAKYRREISEGNINFFVDKDYSGDLKGRGTSKLILEKIDCLRDPVRNMTSSDQDKVIQYLQNLVKLCDLYI